jgi:hypothetical protein
MNITSLYTTNRSNAALAPASKPEGCFPFWRWNVGVYHPYIVMPLSVVGTEATDIKRTLRFKLVSPVDGSFSAEQSVVINDPTGDHVLADYPGTVEAWVRAGSQPNQYCLLFMSDAVISSIGASAKTYGVRQPEDKIPLIASGSHLDASFAKVLGHPDVKAAIEKALPEHYGLLYQLKASHDAR